MLGEGDEIGLPVPPADLLGGPRHVESLGVAARREVGTGHGHQQQPTLGAVELAGLVQHPCGPTEPAPRGRLRPFHRQRPADTYGAPGRRAGCATSRVPGERPLVRLHAAGDVTAEERGLGQHRQVLGIEPLDRVRDTKRLCGLPPRTLPMSLPTHRAEVVHHDHMVAPSPETR